ncbi:hypothetical protein GCM10023213_48040 [Prosthecobacter algae]|uniref:Prepilin-type N-terminal cleavage/methylation domain-containing protein n=1 Tax=Prosthecobacter algae TaxID=1144682 RepID=A0ABP9PP80_9BACT
MTPSSHLRKGFTFVEAVFTIAIIGIMASLAVTAISNGARDANRIMARQQQAAVQEALNAWVLSQARVTSPGGVKTSQVQSMEAIRRIYNNLATTKARFEKLKPTATGSDTLARTGFLDEATITHFDGYSFGSDRLTSAALEGARQYLTLPDWAAGEEPRVILMDE